MISPLVIGGAALLGIGAWAWVSRDKAISNRWLLLKEGQRYAILIQVSGPGIDASMFPGFCNFSEFTPVGGTSSLGFTVQFTAEWCLADRQWLVPENVSVSQVD
jgi:hypothetical protein